VLKDFYLAFGTVCFTSLGLWIIVVQTDIPNGGGARSTGVARTESLCTSRYPAS
jgi:hypothetical protein